jgi:exodeoxyribonuclease V alpha subunit
MNKVELTNLIKTGYFNEIDTQFATFITQISGEDDPDIFLSAALVSHGTVDGDICLDLSSWSEKILVESSNDGAPIVSPKLEKWQKKLLLCPAVGAPGEFRPLILDTQNRLYLYRYWEYEKILSDSLQHRLQKNVDEIDGPLLINSLKRLFPEPVNVKQKIAAVVAAYKRFCVISGGPGTGKTFTVAKILAMLLEKQTLRIYLTAPTGKAAARLLESIETTKSVLDCSDTIKDAFPTEAFTIHRLLRPKPNSPYFYHHAENPLPADVVVVDEASMVDLALMSKLIQAVPKEARMILVGDKDQLASIEAGSVLGDMCDRDQTHGSSPIFREKIETFIGGNSVISKEPFHGSSGLRDCIVILEENYRFSPQSGIAKFSRYVRRGDVDLALDVLKNASDKTVEWLPEVPADSSDSLCGLLDRKIVAEYGPYLDVSHPRKALEKFNHFKILCCTNRGTFGVQEMNRLSETALRKAGLIHPDRSLWYRGRPVLISRNDYHLGLFNGDMGIALPEVFEDSTELAVFFPGPLDETRHMPPHRLSEHDTAYAVTIHKSQGSEFDHVLLLLPPSDSPLLTRELIYTGVTRARKSVTICGAETIVRTAISRKIERTSGLRDALWQ